MAQEFDPVEEASEESFPASDAPGWAMGEETRIDILHDPGKHRFVATVAGETARLDYRLEPDVIVLLHTEVPASMRHLGIGARLARAALDFARREGLRANPQCPVIAKFIERHPEYADLASKPARSSSR